MSTIYTGVVVKTTDLVFHPNKCTYCGVNWDREWYIDTGLEFELEGRLYICDSCFKVLADSAEYINKSEVASQVASLKSRIEEQYQEIERYRAVEELLSSMTLSELIALKEAKDNPPVGKTEPENDGMDPGTDQRASYAEPGIDSVDSDVDELQSLFDGTSIRESSPAVEFPGIAFG